jgi:hypothetical protein
MSLSREETAIAISEHFGVSKDEVLELLKKTSDAKKKGGAALASDSDGSSPKETKAKKAKKVKEETPKAEEPVKEETPKAKKGKAKKVEPTVEEEIPKPKKKAEEAKKEIVPSVDGSAPETKKKTIRLTKEQKSHLAESCGVEEVSEALRKEFVQYVTELTDDDFASKKLDDHISDFAKLKSPEKVDRAVEVLELSELQTLKHLKETEQVGVYQHADRLVTGFPQDGDEECTEIEFEGATYVVGDKTGRVYAVGEKDVFEGFLGVGKFAKMKL